MTPIEDFLAKHPEVANARVSFWMCPDEEHRDKGIVEWRGDVAHCLEPGCGRTSADPRTVRPGDELRAAATVLRERADVEPPELAEALAAWLDNTAEWAATGEPCPFVEAEAVAKLILGGAA
ncbi:hypothetical protein [Amycolatopsis sp. BJA-103]|uniref:hypothetical protein n=1 Tax=Amycolatopsis sp. BJA-103 TaxID=1911175 RepID=UPI000C782CE5|nr:hypothetical protein [Amycolatopsis sp. BJA-103]AUI56804.1 hypothetical protein BKN51_00305 [Amycolatopsis sp. BJA-103]PNE13447.1 hypothetical protein B1H26_40175 [Amycolatopsis sp. BJA-103]